MGPVGGRGIMENGGRVAPPPPPVLHLGAMLGQGFNPIGYRAAMERMGGAYGGFPVGPTTAQFPGLMPAFPPVVAPHVNPSFFGRGGAAGGVGMWPDSGMGGWGGEEQPSYRDDAASDQQHGEGSRGKDRGPDRDWSGDSEKRNDREKDMGPGQQWS